MTKKEKKEKITKVKEKPVKKKKDHGSFFDFINELFLEMRRCIVSVYAGSVTFFIFMSFIPIIILICAILSRTSAEPEILMSVVNDSMPGPVATFVDNCISEISTSSIALLSFSLIFVIWSSGNGYTAMSHAFDRLYNVEHNTPQILRRLKASLYTIIFVVVLTLVLIFLGFGNIINDFLKRTVPGFSVIYQFILHSRFLFSWAFMLLFFMLLYTFLPAKHQKFKKQFPGALVASLGWTGFSILYSFYIEKFDPFTLYGSLTSVMVSLIWLYNSLLILLMGGIINYMNSQNRFTVFAFKRNADLSAENASNVDGEKSLGTNIPEDNSVNVEIATDVMASVSGDPKEGFQNGENIVLNNEATSVMDGEEGVHESV